ncbi:MAG: tRNA uridine-5-carboxymethylaminomethyl(34) synthesis GTPase MnmE [Candidatus Omnitrophica bacterium]|nr:tRNA uridine-5-carboxymethylaminomethyl(34) synthesis GTPase MnmE [Candidatus Omnitrophota bacterium]
MFIENIRDTIAAVTTGSGKSPVGIVRLSGPQALSIVDKIFVSKKGIKPSAFKTYTFHYGSIVYDARALDEVLVSVMRAPFSYTREDVVEINCHGGLLPLKNVLDAVLASGCRMASPGEFTRRAFLNGRIDLAQAEAVAGVIEAKTESALKISLSQLKGGLSKELGRISRFLTDCLVVLEAQIDFPEEDTGSRDRPNIDKELSSALFGINKLLEGAGAGLMLREGVSAVICGRPNVGKSSLLNALLKKERAIVTSVAGTTRDSIEEVVDIKGIPVKIMDTAGILEPRDLIEKKAVSRTRAHIRSADLVIVLFDAGRRLTKEDRLIMRRLRMKDNVIAVINKIDLRQQIDGGAIRKAFPRVVEISARKMKNIGFLEEAIYDFVYQGKSADSESVLVTSMRHVEELRKAQGFIAAASSGLSERLSAELLAQDLKDAVSCLDRILGRDSSASVLDRIFSDFCIGK